MAIHKDYGTDGLLGVMAEIYEEKPGRFDSDPTLVRRLAMQGIDGGNSTVPAPTRVAPDPKADAECKEVMLAAMRDGPASAAEEVFGKGLIRLHKKSSRKCWLRNCGGGTRR